MLATMERMEILDEVDQLTAMILQSEEVEHYLSCKNRVKQDPEAQRLIKTFIKKKEQYEEVQRFGKYHPDYAKVTKEIREWKRKVDMHDTIVEFKKAEGDLQNLLDEISVMIGRSVSEHVKISTGNPFFESSSGCGGGCGTGGSCGCSA